MCKICDTMIACNVVSDINVLKGIAYIINDVYAVIYG